MALDFRIASPCPADWNRMAGDDRIRHCEQCNLNVYNFAELTHKEIEDLVATREGRLCARLYKRADGTLITKDCPVGFQTKVRRISRIAGAALSAAMTAMPVAAQTRQVATSPLVQIAADQPPLAQMASLPATVQIRVSISHAAVVSHASVRLLNLSTKSKIKTRTDSAGRAQLAGVTPGKYELTVKSRDLSTVTQILEVTSGNDLNVEVEMEALQVVVVGVLAEPDDDMSRLPQPGQSTRGIPGRVSNR